MHPDIARLHLGAENDQPEYPSVLTANNPMQMRYSTRQIDIRDITKEFADASAELRQGQLVKDDFFTLFESVGALEIMDPKMDSGFVLPEKDAAVDEFEPLRDMPPAEIIGIMDQLLCFEMAWHKGHALSQTLFTSLHLYSLLTPYFRPLSAIVFKAKLGKSVEQADPLVSIVMRAFCLGIMKCCDSVIQEITSEHYYEEEDFVTQTFAQYILNDYEPAEIIVELQKAIDVLEKQDLADEIKDALRCRLDLRVHLLEAINPLQPGNIVDKSETWKAVLGSLDSVNKTVGLGKETPEAFSERVQRHLASNTPPIPMIKIAWEEAYTRFKRLAEDNIEAFRLMTIEDPSPLDITRFAWDFSSRKPQPSTYSRAVMQGLLFKEGKVLGKTSHIEMVLEDIRSLVMAGDPLLDPGNWEIELPSDPRHQSARQIDEFMAKALDEYINIPRMMLQNRCRMRRTFCQSITILDGLQAEAEQTDTILHSLTSNPSRRNNTNSKQQHEPDEPLQFYPLAAWSYFHKLRIINWTIHLGLELSIYLPEELPPTYRLLSFISHTLQEHLHHISLFLTLRLQTLRKSSDTNPLILSQVQDSLTLISVLITQASLTSSLSSALSTLYTLLSSLSLLPAQKHMYSTPELRYEVRMKPYLQIGTPSLPSHTELSSSTNLSPHTPFTAIFDSITSHLTASKSSLTKLKQAVPPEKSSVFKGCEDAWKAEIQATLGTCVAAGLTVAVLRKSIEGLSDVMETVGQVEGREEEIRQRLVVDEVGEKRFSDFWVVPRVSVRG